MGGPSVYVLHLLVKEKRNFHGLDRAELGRWGKLD